MLYSTSNNAVAALQAQWAWPSFTIPELACRCAGRFCRGEYWHDPAFLDGLQAMRDSISRPLIVTSGHRCAQWNALVGGAPLSQHKRIAADIRIESHNRSLLRSHAQAAGFTGIGLAQSFIHLDRRRTPAIWYYPGSYHLWQT